MTPTYAEARPSYISDAFFVQYNLILLGGAASFSLASASPLPLGCGLVLEAVYLLVAPNLAAFRRYSDSRYTPSVPVTPAAAPPVSTDLDAAHSARLVSFERALSDVQARFRTPQALPLALALDRLDGAGAAFARLCELNQRAQRALTATAPADLEAELDRLHVECEVEQDPMQRVSLRLAQNAVKKKLAQRHELAGKQQTIQLKLEQIEQAMRQALARGADAPNIQELARQLDSVALELSSLGTLEDGGPVSLT